MKIILIMPFFIFALKEIKHMKSIVIILIIFSTFSNLFCQIEGRPRLSINPLNAGLLKVRENPFKPPQKIGDNWIIYLEYSNDFAVNYSAYTAVQGSCVSNNNNLYNIPRNNASIYDPFQAIAQAFGHTPNYSGFEFILNSNEDRSIIVKAEEFNLTEMVYKPLLYLLVEKMLDILLDGDVTDNLKEAITNRWIERLNSENAFVTTILNNVNDPIDFTNAVSSIISNFDINLLKTEIISILESNGYSNISHSVLTSVILTILNKMASGAYVDAIDYCIVFTDIMTALWDQQELTFCMPITYEECYQDLYEPNDTWGEAYNVEVFEGENIIDTGTSKIDSPTDIDIYRLDITNPGEMYVELSNISSDINIRLFAYETGKEINISKNYVNGIISFTKRVCYPQVYYLTISSSIGDYSCLPYFLNMDWSNKEGGLLCSLFNFGSSKKSTQCINCSEILFNDYTSQPIFEGSTYSISAHLGSDDLNQYYNVYAVNTNTGELEGSTAPNVLAKPSQSGPPNITLTGIGCGESVILRAEHVDDPYGCFYEIPIELPPCTEENKTISVAWPQNPNECYEWGTTQTINWTASSNIQSVQIQYCNLGGSCHNLESSYPNTGSYSWTLPPYEGSYYIKLTDVSNNLICDQGYYFEIDDDCDESECDPSVPILLTPSNGQISSIGTDLFVSFDSEYFYPCQFSNYEIWISNYSTFPAAQTSMNNTTIESFNVASLSIATTYFWKVRIINDYGDLGSWSETRSFTLTEPSNIYEFSNPETCTSASNSYCVNNQSSFDLNEEIISSCALRNTSKHCKVIFQWKNSVGDTIHISESPWQYFQDQSLHFISSSYIPPASGNYTLDYYVRPTGEVAQLEYSKSISINAISNTNSYGDFHLNYADFTVIDSENPNQSGQGSSISVLAQLEYNGDPTSVPGNEINVKVGFFLKKRSFSQPNEGWTLFLGEKNINYKCSTTVGCNQVYTKSTILGFDLPYNLEPEEYHILVYADWQNEWFESNESDISNSDILDFDVKVNCESPQNFQIIGSTTNSFTSTWNSYGNELKYDMAYRIKDSGMDWDTIENVFSGQQLYGFNSCTYYDLNLISHCSENDSEDFDLSYATKCNTPCIIPTIYGVITTDSTFIVRVGTLDPAYRYSLQFREQGTQAWGKLGNRFDGIFNVSNLKPGTNYEYQVITYCLNDDNSGWSNTYILTTLNNCTDGLQNGDETGVDCGGSSCQPCDCEQEYYVADYLHVENQYIHVREEILSTGYVPDNKEVNYKAGTSIKMDVGFEVVEGAVYHAIIEECTFDCIDLLKNFGDSCNDGNENTENDIILNDCTCIGENIYDCIGLMLNFGDSCDDNNPDTENDTVQNDCSCIGQIIYDCPLLMLDIGDTCNDENPETENDVVQTSCICAGELIYDCPNLMSNIGDPCDDNDCLTMNDQINVNCLCSGDVNIIQDVDGNTYQTVQIGTQTWMAENLKTTKFRGGTQISSNDGSWLNLTTPQQTWYNRDSINYSEYGRLYNWYSIEGDSICPTGWHIPNESEWDILINIGDAGNKLKETGDEHWFNNNPNVTNETCFTLLPSGMFFNFTFEDVTRNTYFMYSDNNCCGTYKALAFSSSNSGTYNVNRSKSGGVSIRCLKND